MNVFIYNHRAIGFIGTLDIYEIRRWNSRLINHIQMNNIMIKH